MKALSEADKEIFECFKLQGEVIVSCLPLVEDIFRGVLSGANVHEKVRELASLRERATSLKRSIMAKLSNWSSRTIDREDLIHLVSQSEVVVESVSFTVNNLLILRREVAQRVLGLEEFTLMLKGALECARMLGEAIRCFAEGSRDAVQLVEKVNRMEHIVDERHLKLRKKLLGKEFADIPMNLAIEVNRVVEGVESIADRSDNAAETLRMILAGLR